jgi:phage repressor protein C with HTH and peptisase S24 domain
MPAGVISITARRQGTYVLLEAALPGQPLHTIGVFLLDPESGRGYVRLRSRFDDLTGDTDVLDALARDMPARIAATGAEPYLQSLEDSLSNVLRVGERRPVQVDSFTRVLDRLFGEHVEKVEVRPFLTHLPLLTLEAAAGALGPEMVAEPEDWVRLPESVRLSADMFVAHVVGRSMEPLIPEGSLNVFRYNVVGSRQNKIVLVERFGAVDNSGRYSVKKYTSRKRLEGEDEWRHQQIAFVPLNPEFEPWSPAEHEFRVVAEWVRTLE